MQSKIFFWIKNSFLIKNLFRINLGSRFRLRPSHRPVLSGPSFWPKSFVFARFYKGLAQKRGSGSGPSWPGRRPARPCRKKIFAIKNLFWIKNLFSNQIFFESNPGGPEAVQKVDSIKRFRPETIILIENLFWIPGSEKKKKFISERPVVWNTGEVLMKNWAAHFGGSASF